MTSDAIQERLVSIFQKELDLCGGLKSFFEYSEKGNYKLQQEIKKDFLY